MAHEHGSDLVGVDRAVRQAAGAPGRLEPAEGSGAGWRPGAGVPAGYIDRGVDPAAAAGLSSPAAAAPPYTTRGVKTVGVHWLAFTAWTEAPAAIAVVSQAMEVPPAEFEHRMYGGNGYQERWEGPMGAKVYADNVDGGKHVHVVLPGGACELIGGDGLKLMAQVFELRETRIRASRVDLCIDGGDYSPADAQEAFLGGGVRTYSRRDTWSWHNNGEGTMFCMGSRTSERYARVYDRRGPTRFELECKGERAERVWIDLSVVHLDAWPDLIRGHVRDFCDFARPWWDELMGGVARAMLRLGTVALATADSARAWLMRQAAPWLAALTELDGGSLELFEQLLASGKRRYGRGQQLALQGVRA